MKNVIWIALLAVAFTGVAAAETVSVVLVDVPHRTSIPIDFGQELGDITAVEIMMTSNLGPVSVCWDEWDGSFQSYPCGNMTVFYLGSAMMNVDGLGELDHQTWDLWYQVSAMPDLVPVEDWSFLSSGQTSFYLRCYTDGCYADPVFGQGYCGPDPYQVDEVVITVTTGVVPDARESWGSVKSCYR